MPLNREDTDKCTLLQSLQTQYRDITDTIVCIHFDFKHVKFI